MGDKTIYRGGQPLQVSELRGLKMIRNNELGRAVASKLIRDPNQTGSSGYNGRRIIGDDVLNRVSKSTATNIEDSSYIFQTLPDTKIAMEIWVSCLLSPKDGITESLLWSIDHSNTEYSAELFGDMLNVLREYFENEYNIFDILRPAIEDALFKTGSYPLVIIPESSIDQIINGKSAVSSESVINEIFTKDKEGYKVPGIGLLGGIDKKTKIQQGLESLIHNPTLNQSMLHRQIHPGLYVTDNPLILKSPIALRKARKQLSKASIRNRFGLENYAKVNLSFDEKVTKDSNVIRNSDDRDNKDRVFDSKVRNSIVQQLYKDRAYSKQEVVSIKPVDASGRLPIGHPLVLKVPSSAIIPVHVPGNPRDIIGAFIVLDELGNPIDPSNASDLFDTSRQESEERISAATNIIKQTNFYNNNCSCISNNGDTNATLNELAKAYGSLIEEDLLTRLTNGVYGDNVEISHVEEIYRIMLARALSAMNTQVLYVPGELLTYFAFDYNRFGIGKSMLEDARTLANMRAAVQYADIYANIMNSIGRRRLTINVDADDPNPLKTIEYYRNEFLRVNAWGLPLLSEGPIDAINVLREAAIDTVIQGDNPGVPVESVEVEEQQIQRPVPDDNLKDKLQELYTSCFDLPSSIVNDTQSVEFAQQVIQSNMLLNKRVNEKQRIINNDLLYDHITKYVLNSGSLIRSLSLVIKNHKDLLTDQQRTNSTTMPIIEDFLSCLSVSLPSPDRQRVQEQKEDVDRQKELVDSIVDAIIPDSLLENALPDSIKDQATMLKDTYKSILMGRYVSENQYLPYFFNLIDEDNSDDTITTEMKSYINPIVKMSTDIMFALDEIRKVNDSKALKSTVPDDGYGDDDSGDSYDSDDSDGGFDDGYGDEDGEDDSLASEDDNTDDLDSTEDDNDDGTEDGDSEGDGDNFDISRDMGV